MKNAQRNYRLQIFESEIRKIDPINRAQKPILSVSSAGFTLIELIVGTVILGVLVVIGIFALNPSKQIGKAEDAARLQSLGQIKNAMETYYHDTKCYPVGTTSKANDFADALKNGTEWSEGSTVYMKKFPTDPVTKTPYIYQAESSACPQWEIIYVKLDNPTVSSNACPLSTLNNCKPGSFDSSWGCSVSGEVQCQAVAAFELPAPTATPTPKQPAATNTPVPPTPTPTPKTQTYSIVMNTDPWFTAASVYPYPAATGSQQFTADVSSKNTVVSVEVTVSTDTKTNTYPLHLTSGTPQAGTWSGTWDITDTIRNKYLLHIEAKDNQGTTVATEIAYK